MVQAGPEKGHSWSPCVALHSLTFAQGFFNSAEIFVRRAGDRLFVSSRSTDLSSFFE
jgi:hypothetical protein